MVDSYGPAARWPQPAWGGRARGRFPLAVGDIVHRHRALPVAASESGL